MHKVQLTAQFAVVTRLPLSLFVPPLHMLTATPAQTAGKALYIDTEANDSSSWAGACASLQDA